MEQDRFQKNSTLFIVGMLSLIASMILFAISFYIMPHLLFGWIYNVPGFIIHWVEFVRVEYYYSATAAANLVFLFVFLLALFFGIIAYYSSNRIDNEIYSAELQANELPVKKRSNRIGDGQRLAFNIVLIIVVVLMMARLFEWLMYTPPPPTARQTNQVNNMTQNP